VENFNIPSTFVPIFMKLGMYIMPSEPFSMVPYINKTNITTFQIAEAKG
jgi:hypothetical protein